MLPQSPKYFHEHIFIHIRPKTRHNPLAPGLCHLLAEPSQKTLYGPYTGSGHSP
jgi:hypothetical protein